MAIKAVRLRMMQLSRAYGFAKDRNEDDRYLQALLGRMTYYKQLLDSIATLGYSDQPRGIPFIGFMREFGVLGFNNKSQRKHGKKCYEKAI